MNRVQPIEIHLSKGQLIDTALALESIAERSGPDCKRIYSSRANKFREAFLRASNNGGRIEKALEIAMSYGGIDGGRHKTWVIDQMVRALTGCPAVETKVMNSRNPYTYEEMGENDEYLTWVEAHRQDENGEIAYDWDVGIAP